MEISGVVRGLGLRYSGLDINGEGMGIGGVVLRHGGKTYFPLTSSDSFHPNSVIRRLRLNGLSRRYLGPFDVTEAHRYIREKLTPMYVGGGSFSPLFEFLMKVRSRLLKTRYVMCETIESCEVRYAFSKNSIQVKVKRENGRGRLIVANEFSGELFDTILLDGEYLRPGPWTRINHTTPILSSTKLGLGIQFILPDGTEVFAGREVQLPRLNWAGVDIALEEGETDVSYEVRVSHKTSRRRP